MANSVTSQIIIDGPRNTVVKVAGILDTSDLASTVVADPAVLVGIDNTGGLEGSYLPPRRAELQHRRRAGGEAVLGRGHALVD